MRRLLLQIAGLAIALSATLVQAQQSTLPTLHVYTNLIQIPVLVLSPSHKQLAPISQSRFAISLDSGPKFRPNYVRFEGDDPITLSILLDVSGADAKLMPGIDDAIANLAPRFLHPGDHVSIYVLGCALVTSLVDVPANSAQLKRGVDIALRKWSSPHCKQTVHLWDTLIYMSQEMSKLPGRRVILAVTDGKDKGSSYTWNQLRVFAGASGVAIFGMARKGGSDRPGPQNGTTDSMLSLIDPQPLWGGSSLPHGDREDIFRSLCQLTGGLVLTPSEGSVAQALKQFTTLLRGRYIVEFPRSNQAVAGPSSIVVTIDKSNAFVRPAGISFPIADPRVLDDPSTIHPTNAPDVPQRGKRRILLPSH